MTELPVVEGCVPVEDGAAVWPKAVAASNVKASSICMVELYTIANRTQF
jgi:hypothetical protein